jgi:hypothetical protein
MADYCKILGLPPDPTPQEIKIAYRKLARQFHPDINHSPDAKDKFILITEAYEFLITNQSKLKEDSDAFDKAMEDWRIYRQDRSRKRAKVYAGTSYNKFRNTKLYKSTKILDSTPIIFSFIISIIVILFTIFGYIFRLRHPIPGLDKPSVFAFIMLLLIGMIFFVVSFIHLRAYQETSKKNNTKR